MSEAGRAERPPSNAPEVSTGSRPPKVSRWQRHAHIIGLVILVAVSIYGIVEFVTGDAEAVTAYWSHHYTVLPLVLLFGLLDVAIEMVAWIWVYRRFGMKVRDLTGVAVGLSGKAGLLLPAQLGRLIRPDLMVRLGRGSMADCLKAEAVVFVLDSISVLALFGSLVAYRVNPLLAPLAGAVVIGTALYLGNRILKLLSDTRLALPRGFWWQWKTFAIVVVQASGWVAHGLAFYVLASGLPGNVGLWDSLFMAPGSAVLGLGSGLPGGLGATEALLGVSLGLKGVPQAHLALGVAAFRIVTFWILLPIGWMGFAFATRQARKRDGATS